MTNEHKPTWTGQQQAERAIVLQALRDEHPQRWRRSELEIQLAGIDVLTVNDAIELLARTGVVILDGENVHAAASVRRLDDLGLVAI